MACVYRELSTCPVSSGTTTPTVTLSATSVTHFQLVAEFVHSSFRISNSLSAGVTEQQSCLSMNDDDVVYSVDFVQDDWNTSLQVSL